MIESIILHPVFLWLVAVVGVLIVFAATNFYSRRRAAPCGHRFVHAVLSNRTVCSTCHADVTKDVQFNVILADPIVDFLEWWGSCPISKLAPCATRNRPLMTKNEMRYLANLYQSEKQDSE